MPTKERSQTPNRVRAYKPKVKTGCITCRIRHKKCDETKPHCQRCISTGRKCDGYLSTPSSSNNSPSPSKITPLPKPQFKGNDLERRSFDFFCKRTVLTLSGIFDPTFWTRLVLQATHHEPAIRHAVVALGALHETSELGSREGPSIFALQQYGKAMGCLINSTPEEKKRAADVALMTCVLFVCFEIMREHHGTAISHIESGVKIISSLQSGVESTDTWSLSRSPYAEPSILNPIFIRLDRQVSEITFRRKRQLLDHVLDDKVSGYHTNIPMTFTSLEQARNSLDHIRTLSVRFMKKAMPDPSFRDPAKKALTLDVLKTSSFIRLQQWSTAFNSFIRYHGDFDTTGQEAVHVLKMHRIFMGIVMGVDEERSFADETVWDQYKPQYEAIVAHATSVIELKTRDCETEGRKRATFNLDSGINFPLIFVASKCRDGAIRRKAIQLLRTMDRYEGIWNSILSARVAERLISIEEKGLVGEEEFLKASEIPNENRLGGAETRWMTDRRVQMIYTRKGRMIIGGDSYQGGNVVMEELLEW
ncbi:uncharacterized protein LY89DRAFT_778907 [Mollisia scopiformis]|uniref:Zn(2)-C6 fungal-type domain-containing protein n=1 Tax=Mollisia scopiformis TaxID=149040 RepID=A0A194XME4_MOLSC|nr:uncharacterized protein LY89DRAFT_778907 [Mollisia scopiformis]KUJ21348.1 hypothetical protein LY89DRAFT_778907 [Mollisia scopiformis]